MSAASFADRLVTWYDEHGRHDLPWQRDRNAYRVWVSEIMLQQTRVATVIPYFDRFTTRFPGVTDLATAEVDAVLGLWSGLGYYGRARHLHQAARILVARHGGVFPTDLEAWCALPGVGRSTAAAVLALAMEIRHPILDGNVKRVLTRHQAIAGWPQDPSVLHPLWALAEACTPHQRVAAYTQAIMDVGATVCTRTRPACVRCPVGHDCRAYALGRVADFPTPRPKRVLPIREIRLVMLVDSTGAVLLERRPSSGVWGGCGVFLSVPQITIQRSGLPCTMV